jgi:hypothetical protein
MPPVPGADPRESLRWARRAEIAGGIFGILGALVLWDVEWVRWILLGLAVVAFLPWLGPAAILRRSERDQTVLETDPQRGRARARKVVLILVPALVVASALAGYIIDGVGTATFMAVLVGLAALLGAWPFLRRAA